MRAGQSRDAGGQKVVSGGWLSGSGSQRQVQSLATRAANDSSLITLNFYSSLQVLAFSANQDC
jgi:hypothetical protein